MPQISKSSGQLFFTLPVRRRQVCLQLFPVLRPTFQATFSTSLLFQQDDLASTASETPRWKAPPPQMVTQGTRNRSFRPPTPEFLVNEDPAKLDKAIVRLLGRNGDQMLTEEVKWLAVTHKSFDHGRRGFNDRLAYLGGHWNPPYEQ